MKKQFIKETISQMKSNLNVEQVAMLEIVLTDNLKNKDIIEIVNSQPKTNKEALSAFISSKRIEGCSAKSLAFYETTMQKMFSFIPQIYYSISTEDIRNYLSDYQIQHNISKATIDNMRRIISSLEYAMVDDENVKLSHKKYLG